MVIERAALGRVDKVIHVIATSPQSWERAAQTAVGEAAQTIRDLDYARVVKHDLTLVNGQLVYRIKLQMAFQLDRSRIDASAATVQVCRTLILANQTLAGDKIAALIANRSSIGPTEFHVVVPQNVTSTLFTDPATGVVGPAGYSMAFEARDAAKQQAGERLHSFMESFGHLGDRISGEVVLTDPVAAVRRVLSRSSFDDIVVSTLPAGISRWLRLDLPSRIERTFNLPVTTLVQQSGE